MSVIRSSKDVNARLQGKRIGRIALNAECINGQWLTQPTIYLTDGTRLDFWPQEPRGGGEYGVALVIDASKKKAPRPTKGGEK